MKFSRRQYARRFVFGLALFVVTGWLAPRFFSAERYRRRLETGLERALRRPVTFGSLTFRLLPHPGLIATNAEVREDPAFGSEPFARVDRLLCDLRWRSLWRSQLECSRLRLERPSFNLVRSSRGEWNVEDLLLKSGAPSEQVGASASRGGAESTAVLELELVDARLNFKVGADKKAFAVTDVSGLLSFEAPRRSVRFRLAGNPIRTDVSYPTPGKVELAGEWSPGQDPDGRLNATLRTRGALLYNWVPLVTGYNPEIYGVLDADIQLAGSMRLLKVAGEGSLSQIHRWEQLPPSDSLRCSLNLRGQLDRRRGQAFVESFDASFADSRVHLSGSLEKIPTSPELDFVVAIERSRMEDLLALGRRLSGHSESMGLSGRVDGLLTVQGPWNRRRYGGFVSARGARLTTPEGLFALSELAMRIDNAGARLAPVKLTLAPRVELIAEGTLKREGGTPRYELGLSAKAVPLKDLMRFGRAVGVQGVQGLDAQGSGTATLRLVGSAWPLSRPNLTGRAEVHAARLLVAGLTEPLQIPRARVQFKDDQVIVDPLVAVIGTSVFSARLEHRGERKRPWEFDVRANNLNIQQGALWFDALGLRRPRPLLERLPGLGTFTDRRVAASNLFGALNAQGHLATPVVTYRALTLKDFRASVEISGRTIRVAGTSFRAGGGRGQGRVQLDLTNAPATIQGEIALEGANVRSLASILPGALQGVHGVVSGAGQFQTRGLTRREMTTGLRGEATVRLRNVAFGDFDPLDSLVRRAGVGILEPARGQTNLQSAVVGLEVRDRQVFLRKCSLDIAGAKIKLDGVYAFGGAVELNVLADVRHFKRHWLEGEDGDPSSRRFVTLRLTGPLGTLAVAPEEQAARVSP